MFRHKLNSWSNHQSKGTHEIKHLTSWINLLTTFCIDYSRLPSESSRSILYIRLQTRLIAKALFFKSNKINLYLNIVPPTIGILSRGVVRKPFLVFNEFTWKLILVRREEICFCSDHQHSCYDVICKPAIFSKMTSLCM